MTPEHIQILYVEKRSHPPAPIPELLTTDGFPNISSTTIKEAKQILQNSGIRLVIINTSLRADDGHEISAWGRQCLEFIRDADYLHIPKIIVEIDGDALEPYSKELEEKFSVIHFYYRIDPDRRENLNAKLREHFDQ